MDRSKTVQALPILVGGLQQRGYRFVTVPELMAMANEKRRGVVAAGIPKRN